MKKSILILLVLILVTLISAHHLTPVELSNSLKINYGGDFRVRGIAYNDFYKNNGSWCDNRLQLDFNAMIAEKIGLTWNIAVGDIIWGDYPSGGGYYTRGINLKTREMFLDYEMCNMKARIGQQYWCDPTSLVLDDDFSGITFDSEMGSLVMESGIIKGYEGATDRLDDATYGFVNFMIEEPYTFGLMGMYGNSHDPDPTLRSADAWAIPYMSATFAPIDISLAAVLNNQWFRDANNKVDSEMGMGVTAKVNADLGVNIGANVLYVTDKGLNSLSPYYTNGLVIFGVNSDFDSNCIGWGNSSYGAIYNSGEAFMSVVGKVSYPLSTTMNVFANAGYLTLEDPIGMEFNAGFDNEIAKDVHLIFIGAAGQSDKGLEVSYDDDNNMVYFLGGIIKAGF